MLPKMAIESLCTLLPLVHVQAPSVGFHTLFSCLIVCQCDFSRKIPFNGYLGDSLNDQCSSLFVIDLYFNFHYLTPIVMGNFTQ